MRRVRRACVGWVLAAAALAVCCRARAREVTPELKLSWSAPEGCPDQSAARAAIEDALAKNQADGAKAMVVRVRIAESEPGHWVGDIWMYDAGSSGERSIEGSNCREVARAITLVVALALDESKAPPRKLHAPVVKPAQPRPQFALEVALAGDLGSLSQPAPGLALIAGLQLERWSLELQASAWLPRSAKVGAVGGTFQLYTGAARGCMDLLGLGGAGPRFGPCLSAELGGMIGAGTGLAHRESENILWIAGLAGAYLRLIFAPPVMGTLHFDVGVPFRRPAWQIAELGPVFQPDPVVWRLLLGLGWSFP